VTAILVYAIALALDLRWQTNWAVYLITTPLGFILFGVSLFKVRRTPRVIALEYEKMAMRKKESHSHGATTRNRYSSHFEGLSDPRTGNAKTIFFWKS